MKRGVAELSNPALEGNYTHGKHDGKVGLQECINYMSVIDIVSARVFDYVRGKRICA